MYKSAEDDFQAIILTNQVDHVIGKTERTAQRRLEVLRKARGREKNGPVSVLEFCHYFGYDEEFVRHRLKQIKPDYKD